MGNSAEGSKRGKKWFLLALPVLLIPSLLIATHEVSVRYYQDVACVACHEMKDPVKKWQDSGTAKNHKNCLGCHADTGFAGWVVTNERAAKFFVVHFERPADQPLEPPKEPLFWEGDKEAGYWSLVPNHRCFQCHDAKNHREIDQPRIHESFVKDVNSKPCIDCHNHEMRNGRKFYEKVLPDVQVARSDAP